MFSIIGDYVNYKPFKISINNLAFGNDSSLGLEDTVLEKTLLRNYPNPFKNNTTIKLINNTRYLDIKVIDVLGRTVDLQHIVSINKKVKYNAPNLSKGIYKYVLVDDSKQHYRGTFMVE